MKMFELTHYKKVPAYQHAKSAFADTTTLNKSMMGMKYFDASMKDLGFINIGNGGFANIYERPGYPWVFKVFSSDAAYLDWLKFVTTHQGNEHVPKVRGKPFKINDNTYAIRMEKLTKLPSNFADNPLVDLIMWAGVPLTKRSEEEVKRLGHADIIPVLHAIRDLIYSTDTTRDYGNDLHAKNIMLRGNTVVITDPVVDLGKIIKG